MKEFRIDLNEVMAFSSGGIFTKEIVEGEKGDATLFCMAAGAKLSEHTSTREAFITVFKGKGKFDLAGKEVDLAPGTFIYMPANTKHGLSASEDLAFVLNLA